MKQTQRRKLNPAAHEQQLTTTQPATSTYRRYLVAKVVLVGENGVGKSTLGWTLAHGEYKEPEPNSQWQQFWPFTALHTTLDDGMECEVVICDLAGQPDYRLIHSLLLDDADLALIIIDPTIKHEPLNSVEFWLKALSNQKERRCPTIMVGARIERGSAAITDEALMDFCQQHGIEGGYIGVSAQTGYQMEELVERVRGQLVWEKIQTPVSQATYKQIKEHTFALKNRGQQHLLSLTELSSQLKTLRTTQPFSDEEMLASIELMAKHGDITMLRGPTGDKHLLLTPELLTNLAGSFIFEAWRESNGLGALRETNAMYAEYDFAEIKGQSESERKILTDAVKVLFLEHNLCFRASSGMITYLIFPALINVRKPTRDEAEVFDDVTYIVTGAVEYVYAALVVLLGYTSNFIRTNQWHNQAQYETSDGDICGFRQIAQHAGEIRLVIYYGTRVKPATQKLFEGLFEIFLGEREVKATKFPSIVCPKCQTRHLVIERVLSGKGHLFCGECKKKLILPKAGEEVVLKHRVREETRSTPGERQVLANEHSHAQLKTFYEGTLVGVKAFVRDRGWPAQSPSCFISYAWGNTEQERWVYELASNLKDAGIEVILDQKDNAFIGEDIARFMSDSIERSDFVIVVGTPLYKQKYENRLSSMGSKVAAEVDLIHLRLTRDEKQKRTVLPLLLEGDERISLPPLMQGKVHANFRQEGLYFASLFDLILTLYQIPAEHQAVKDLRAAMRRELERFKSNPLQR